MQIEEIDATRRIMTLHQKLATQTPFRAMSLTNFAERVSKNWNCQETPHVGRHITHISHDADFKTR